MANNRVTRETDLSLARQSISITGESELDDERGKEFRFHVVRYADGSFGVCCTTAGKEMEWKKGEPPLKTHRLHAASGLSREEMREFAQGVLDLTEVN